MHLPVLAQSQAQIDQSPPPAAIPPLRILVVDDNRDAAETLGALLGALGGTVKIVHGGRAALEVIEDFRPDAVLLDIGMPEMDGYEVARRIRETSSAEVTIIALTGWGQEQDYRQSRAAGVDHHLVKPLDMNKLRALLTSAAGVRTRP